MITVKNLSKSFKLSKQQQKETGDQQSLIYAVKDISFTCQPGRICSLLGPNGAGKTTTLRMLSTILKPSAGSIEVAGYDAIGEPQEVRRRIGFLTGSTGLYKRLSPNEIVKYFADLYQVPKAVLQERKEKLYTLLDVHDFANKRIGHLSTGMLQKVSIIRTMIHDPEVVIFDEPTSGLDVITAENIINLIRQCKVDNKTVIFSSHIMSEIDLLCDDLIIIHKGKICYNDTFDTFQNQMQAQSLTEEFIRIIKAQKTLS